MYQSRRAHHDSGRCLTISAKVRHLVNDHPLLQHRVCRQELASTVFSDRDICDIDFSLAKKQSPSFEQRWAIVEHSEGRLYLLHSRYLT